MRTRIAPTGIPAWPAERTEPDELVGRERECDLLRALFAAMSSRGAALVLHGEPGVGKTALLEFAADASSNPVLWIKGAECEAVLPFAALGDLLLPLRSYLGQLPAAQRCALEVCLAVSTVTPASPYVTCAATLNLLAAASESAPLLVLIDDFQWIDPSSHRVLAFVARRLNAERVGMVIAHRDETGLDAVSDVPSIGIGGLARDACAELLRRRGLEVDPHLLTELVELTAGNPLGLVEITNTFGPDQLCLGGLSEMARPGEHLERAWGQRLDALPEPTRAALVVVATSHSTSIDAVEPALAAHGLALSALAPAESAGLIHVTCDGAEFRHPLLRSVIRARTPMTMRIETYRLLAAVAPDDHRPWYLAAASTGPDEAIAHQLAGIAARAEGRGAYDVAAAAWARAADLTPCVDERAARFLQAAATAHLGGSTRVAAANCEAALRLVRDPRLRADVELLRGRVHTWSGQAERAYMILNAAASRAGPVDPTRAGALLAEATLPAVMTGKVARAVRDAQTATTLAPGSPACGVAAAHALIIVGRVSEGRAHLDALADALDHTEAVEHHQALSLAGACRIWAEDHDEAHRLLNSVVDAARRTGAVVVLAHALAARSELDRWTGRWATAYADATEGLRWAQEIQQMPSVGATLACLARIDAARGDRAGCEDFMTRARLTAGPLEIAWQEIEMMSILGLDALTHGEHELAEIYLERSRTLAGDHGLGNPVVVPFAADLIETLVHLHKADRADDITAQLEQRAVATGLTWPAAAAARCRGLLATAFDEAEEAFSAADNLHRRRAMPFERARTLLCWGQARRRFRRPAASRAPLLEAMETFTMLGARPWARRAAAELAATGERHRTRSTGQEINVLSPQELQIARAIAHGMSNLEAAAALFLSRKTVEAHLTRAYRKLGVRSRTELTRVLLAEGIGDTR
ncbi:MAG: AAA family ATPase [Pseudonocardiaceae bacterium]